MNNCEHSVTVARLTTSQKEWFNSTSSLKILNSFPSNKAMEFRKRHIKGFIVPGSCNHYIGVSSGNLLFGILGFSNPTYGNYDLLLKADTTPSEYNGATELLLYILRTREVKRLLENKFCREINTIYSMCFSSHQVISRYRKHGELVTKIPIEINNQNEGCNLGYIFQTGSIVSLKEAKARFIQKWKN